MEPDTNSDQRRVIPASEILGKIKRGEPVEYDGVIVEGDLDLSGQDLPRNDEGRVIVTVPFKIKKSAEIRGEVNFGNAVFKEVVIFGETSFLGDANFEGAQFSSGAPLLTPSYIKDITPNYLGR